MNNKKKIIATVVAALIITPVVTISSISSEKAEMAGMVRVCSDVTKGQMKSPSSYIMGKAVIDSKEATPAELREKLQETSMERMREALESGRMKYLINDVYVDYEAKNSFGTLLKSTAYCKYDVISSSGMNSYEMMRMVISDRDFMGTDLSIMLSARDFSIGRETFKNKFSYIKYHLTGKL